MKIFVNLPVTDLNKSKEFYTKLGFTINEQFTDETAACVVMTEDIYVMILTHEKFKSFSKKEIVDAHTSAQVLNALTFDAKEKVDEMYEKAMAAGGKESRPTEDQGFMYGRYIEDLDGNIWELIWMDMSQVQ